MISYIVYTKKLLFSLEFIIVKCKLVIIVSPRPWVLVQVVCHREDNSHSTVVALSMNPMGKLQNVDEMTPFLELPQSKID